MSTIGNFLKAKQIWAWSFEDNFLVWAFWLIENVSAARVLKTISRLMHFARIISPEKMEVIVDLGLFFVLFSLQYQFQFQFQQNNWRKHRWFAWDSNLEPQMVGVDETMELWWPHLVVIVSDCRFKQLTGSMHLRNVRSLDELPCMTKRYKISSKKSCGARCFKVVPTGFSSGYFKVVPTKGFPWNGSSSGCSAFWDWCTGCLHQRADPSLNKGDKSWIIMASKGTVPIWSFHQRLFMDYRLKPCTWPGYLLLQ